MHITNNQAISLSLRDRVSGGELLGAQKRKSPMGRLRIEHRAGDDVGGRVAIPRTIEASKQVTAAQPQLAFSFPAFPSSRRRSEGKAACGR